jgi:hypothetical protein
VCEKSDGVRYLLYFAIPPSGPVAFLVIHSFIYCVLIVFVFLCVCRLIGIIISRP